MLQKAKSYSSKTTKEESLFEDCSYLNRYLWHDTHISKRIDRASYGAAIAHLPSQHCKFDGAFRNRSQSY